ncbi:MAG: extracellular solute-binding protein [Chloroflexota bacterium]
MHDQKLSRRNLLKLMGAGSAALALAACAPAAGPGGSSEGGDAPDAAKKEMSIATFAAVLHDWQREFAARWADENPDVDLTIEEVVYGEMGKLQLARSASGTLWDLVFSGIKWFPFSASKGMFLALDDMMEVRAEDAKLDDFFPAALAGGYLDGALYGLPYEIHPGNPALVAINVDYWEEKGVPLPVDDEWDVMQYRDIAESLTDIDNNMYGTDYWPGNYYDFQSLVRAFGAEIMDESHDNFVFNMDDTNIEAAEWIWSLRADRNVAVPQEMMLEGVDFTAGALASDVTGSYSVNRYITEIGDSFNVDFAIFPYGPDGSRGFTAFTSNYSCYSETNHPDEAVDLLLYLSSTEAGLWSALEQGTGQPNARFSVWEDETLLSQSHPIFERVLNKLYRDDALDGSFPIPSNLRFQELQDNWANTMPELFHGNVPFEEGMQAVQDACQEIMELPRA